MDPENIVIRGARQHNLKGIDLTIPRNKLVVITGLSGSGKSSLAFDTLYAEGQRRYVESLSTYARQFLERLEKPDVEIIEGLSPAIAIEQKTASHNPRSTVGTVTEIYDYLRLLFARVGIPHCYQCGAPIMRQTIDQMIDQVMAYPKGTRIILYAPLVDQQKGSFADLFSRLKRDGFARVRIDGRVVEVDSIASLDKQKKHSIDVMVDRLIVKEGLENRLADSMELALAESNGLVILDFLEDQSQEVKDSLRFSEKAACVRCGISYTEFSPASFSFNSPQGACSECDGLGVTTAFDPERVVPNPSLSLRLGAVAPWANRNTVPHIDFLEALTGHYDVDIYMPFEALPASFQKVVLYGSGDEKISFFHERGTRRHHYLRPFEGIIPNLQRRYRETDSRAIREEISQYLSFKTCTSCGGTKLNRVSRSVTVGGNTISGICALSVTKAIEFFEVLVLSGKRELIAKRILKEIKERLVFLKNVGLSYLTLDRAANTLSGGESQRIRLATQIGSKLTGVLYVLDEPSIGLHPRDNRRLLEMLMEMRNLGNTVMVVEHDEEAILAAAYVVDMGPGAGVHGGEVIFAGNPKDLMEEPRSLTGQYLSGKKQIPVPQKRRTGNAKTITIKGASSNNLKQIHVNFPLGTFICVTGVSGSGKSTLVLETLCQALSQRLYHSRVQAGRFDEIKGLSHIDKVVHIDQGPIGKTPRSNPGTYTGVFTHIRDLFAKIPEARMRGFTPGRFSFNVKGGRCEACSGDGILKIEMHFLPDVYVTCDVCGGARYNRETLEIRYKGKSIADVLDMTVNQCLGFFDKIGVIRTKLQTLVDVGIGYVRIGQSATTLSGGEAQRVKLAKELSKKGTGRTIYILDEPTTGLHMEDINKLLDVLTRLVDAGNTVVVIEHNLDVIKTADYIIDLGPEGGDAGGEVVGCGTPEQISRIPASWTGKYLRRVL
jgi:excinuclease ABC subunit A